MGEQVAEEEDADGGNHGGVQQGLDDGLLFSRAGLCEEGATLFDEAGVAGAGGADFCAGAEDAAEEGDADAGVWAVGGFGVCR